MEQMTNRAQTVIADTLIAAGAFLIAYLLSATRALGLDSSGLSGLNLAQLTAIYATLAAVFSTMFRRELSPWRYVSVPDTLVLARTAMLTAGVFLLAVFVIDRASGLARSVLALAPILQMVGSMGARIARRALHEHALDSFAPMKPVRDRAAQAPSLLLIGPTALADTYLRDVARRHDHAWTPVGIVSPDSRDIGQQVRSVCVIECIQNLDAALADLRRWNRYPRAILFLDEPGRLKGLTADLLGRLKNDGIRLLRLPSIVELSQHDGVSLLPMREISVEELLAREPIELDRAAVGALIRGRRVLITGAGGSIGAELCRQVAAFQAAHITLLDFSETSLFEIDREMGEVYPNQSRHAALVDVRNADRVRGCFLAEKPDLVFHAAALKHVSMVERHPCEGILTNVVGTWNVAEAARACGAAQMVLISTDKAVDPSNVMGATKRLAEAVIQAQQFGQGARFSAVRFGNVLGSSGSVAPLFQRQIAEGGPITLTHPDVSRYFMTLGEAVSLLLQAATLREMPSEVRGGVYVMDIGDPIRIADLARLMIRMSGRRPEQDIEVRVIGLRPGEKLDEELIHPDEDRILRTASGLSLVGPRTMALDALRACFDRMQDAVTRLDREAAITHLREIVPEFEPIGSETGLPSAVNS